MDATARFEYLRRKLRKKAGPAGTITREADRELALAASIELVLETSRHEMMLGKKLDPVLLAGLRAAMAVALMQSTIEQTKRGSTEKYQ
jgi:hypothetical protein